MGQGRSEKGGIMKTMILDQPNWFRGCVGKRVKIVEDRYDRPDNYTGKIGVVTDEAWHVEIDGHIVPILHGSKIGFLDDAKPKTITQGPRFFEEYAGATVRLVSLNGNDAYREENGYMGRVIGKLFKVGRELLRDVVGHRNVFFLSGAKYELVRRGK
jgi:hypothetical protein